LFSQLFGDTQQKEENIIGGKNMIDKNKIKSNRPEKQKMISIRLPVSACKFMGDNGYSPTKIMTEALRELGWDSKQSSQPQQQEGSSFMEEGSIVDMIGKTVKNIGNRKKR
jgi:hypothetical protein